MTNDTRSQSANKPALVVGVLLLIFAALVGYDASQQTITSTYGVGPTAMPYVVAAGLAILGLAPAAHLAPLLAPVAGSVTVLPLATDETEAPAGLTVAGSAVVGMRDTGSAVEVTLADGGLETVDVVFAVPALRQRAPFAARLELELTSSGCVRVDEFQRTSLPGLFAAGDMAQQSAYPMPMASVATRKSTSRFW